MPRRSIRTAPLEKREQQFIDLFVKTGGNKDQIHDCERRAHLKAGHGQKLLRRKKCQQEIATRLAPVEKENLRSEVVGDAVKAAMLGIQDHLQRQFELAKTLKIDPAALEGLLMQGALVVDWQRAPKEKLEIIKAAAVWNGIFESGNTRRLAPPETGELESTGGVYTDLFARLSLTPAKPEHVVTAAPVKQDDTVYDLIPPPAAPPPPKAPPVDVADSKVIVVEVG